MKTLTAACIDDYSLNYTICEHFEVIPACIIVR